jgi:hypothetical protein
MIHDIDLEIAKLLIDKNFTIHHTIWYNEDGTQKTLKIHKFPTISDITTWLYEKHGIWVEIPFWDSKFRVKIIDVVDEIVLRGIDFEGYDSPADAYQSAITYCITKLI